MIVVLFSLLGAAMIGWSLYAAFSATPAKPEGSAGFSSELRHNNAKIGEARDIRLSLTRGEVETTSQDTDGWKSFVPGLAEASMTFTLYRKHPESAGANTLRAAFMAGQIVREVEMIDKFGYGWRADLVINDMSEDWSFDNAIQNSVSARVTGQPIQISPDQP